MISEFGFLNPPALFALPGALLLALFLWRAEKTRLSRLVRLSEQPPGARVSRSRIVLPALISASILLALARPYWGRQEIELPVKGGDYLLLIDVSKSMLARDIHPSRLEAAKRKTDDIVRRLKERGHGDRVGLILFSGRSYLYCPLTSDYEVVRFFASGISSGLITAEGSNITEAFRTALDSFAQTKAADPHLILLSDGEDNESNPESIRTLLAGAKVRVHALGIGTPEGQPIEEQDGSFVKDQSGTIVISRLNEPLLRSIAESTDGTYQPAGLAESDIDVFLTSRSAGGEEQQERAKKMQVFNEFGCHLLALPLLLALLALVLRRPQAVFALALLLAAGQAAAEEASGSLRQAYEAYQAGEYQKALDIFSKAHTANPQDRKIKDALAHTHFKLGNSSEAARLFSELAAGANKGRQQFEAGYNLGNSHLQARQYQPAIEAYERALQIKPKDEQAEFNLELARRLLAEQQKQEQERKQQQKQQEQQQQQEQQERQPQEQQQPERQHDQRQQQQDTQRQEQGREEGERPEKKDPEQGQEQEHEQVQEPEQDQRQEPGVQAEERDLDPAELKRREAEAWLESLPDEPVLLPPREDQRKVRGPRQGQTW